MEVSDDFKKLVSQTFKEIYNKDTTLKEIEDYISLDYTINPEEKVYLIKVFNDSKKTIVEDSDEEGSGSEEEGSSDEEDAEEDGSSDEEDAEEEDADAEVDAEEETVVEEDKKTISKPIKQTKGVKEVSYTKLIGVESEEDSDDSDYYDSDDEQVKFDDELRKNQIINYHNDLQSANFSEIVALSKVVKDSDGNIIDDLHNTIPILTKFEKTKIIGVRTKQLDNGSEPFIPISETIIESYIIAEMELKEKKLPFIIARPLPNGKKEYWKLSDLEYIE